MPEGLEIGLGFLTVAELPAVEQIGAAARFGLQKASSFDNGCVRLASAKPIGTAADRAPPLSERRHSQVSYDLLLDE